MWLYSSAATRFGSSNTSRTAAAGEQRPFLRGHRMPGDGWACRVQPGEERNPLWLVCQCQKEMAGAMPDVATVKASKY